MNEREFQRREPISSVELAHISLNLNGSRELVVRASKFDARPPLLELVLERGDGRPPLTIRVAPRMVPDLISALQAFVEHVEEAGR